MKGMWWLLQNKFSVIARTNLRKAKLAKAMYDKHVEQQAENPLELPLADMEMEDVERNTLLTAVG